MFGWETIEHKPAWAPGPVRVAADGQTTPGFWCVHILENGNGPCGASWMEEVDNLHYCVVIAKHNEHSIETRE